MNGYEMGICKSWVLGAEEENTSWVYKGLVEREVG